MCLIIIAHRMSADYPLLLAANRDEFFARPTRPARLWPEEAFIAGRDLTAGGIWLGVGLDGRFAAVTNVRESGGDGAGLRSRGELPLNYLRGDLPPDVYLEKFAAGFNRYAGFNLLVGDTQSTFCASNRADGIHEIGAEIFGLSNGPLGSQWPKIARGRNKLAELLTEGAEPSTDSLLANMRDQQLAEDAELPATGLPARRESRLSSMFIPVQPGGYGTRCSSALVRRGDGLCHFAERNFDVEGVVEEQACFQFSLAGVG